MRDARFAIAAVALLLAQAASAWAAHVIPAGESRFEFIDGKGQPGRPIVLHSYRPADCDAKCPLVIVMAGVQRNAADYRGYWESSADRYHLVIVAPEFSNKAWPRAAAYSQGDVAAQRDPEKWAFSAIEHLFDEVAEGRKDYVLFGHSAGGQFVHRMALFRPDARAAMMVAANPGWYTLPEWRAKRAADPFPYSLVDSAVSDVQLKGALERPFTLMLGTRDVDPDARNLDRSAGSERQGRTRFERGHTFFAAAQQAARDLDVHLAWKLVEVPGVAHEGDTMSRAAADLLFGKP
jgi:poly(3-hydroxybutyrate) depolymerase